MQLVGVTSPVVWFPRDESADPGRMVTGYLVGWNGRPVTQTRIVQPPAGWQQGDIAILITAMMSQSIDHIARPSTMVPSGDGWRPIGTDSRQYADTKSHLFETRDVYYGDYYAGQRTTRLDFEAQSHVTYSMFWKPVGATAPTAAIPGWPTSWKRSLLALYPDAVESPVWAMMAIIRGSSGVGLWTPGSQIRTNGGSLTLGYSWQTWLVDMGMPTRTWSPYSIWNETSMSFEAPDATKAGPFTVFEPNTMGDSPQRYNSAGDFLGSPGSGWHFAQAFFDTQTGGTSGPEKITTNNPDHVFMANSRPIHAFTIELLPLVDPLTPSLVTPMSTVAKGTVEFVWKHNPVVAGGTAKVSKLKRFEGSNTYWWSGSAWVTTDTAFTHTEGTTIAVTAPMDVGDHSWQVQTQEVTDGRWSPWSTSASFKAVTPPTATLTSVGDGGYEPLIEWTADQPTAGFQLAVYGPDGLLMWDSGDVLTSATSYRIPQLLWVNGETYSIRLVVIAESGVKSAPVSADLPVSWVNPDPPSVRAEAVDGGILAEVPGSDGLTVRIERWEGAGWVPVVRTSAPVSLVDRLAPYGVPVVYRARVDQGTLVGSEWAHSAWVTSGLLCDWVVSVEDPSIAAPTHMIEESPVQYPRESAVRTGTGDRVPMVTHGPIQARRSSMRLRVESEADAEAMMVLLSGPCWLRRPAGARGRDRTPGGVIRISWVGGTELARVVQAPNDDRDMTVDWVEGDPPRVTDMTPPPDDLMVL